MDSKDPMRPATAHDRITRLYAITTDIQAGLAEKFRLLLDLGIQQFGFENGGITRIHGESCEIVACAGSSDAFRAGATVPIALTYCDHTIVAAEPVIVRQAQGSEWENHQCFQQFAIEAYLGVRIQVDHQPWGTLCFFGHEAIDHTLNEEDLLFLKLMAQWVGHELERTLHRDKLDSFSEWRKAILDSANLTIIATDPKGVIVSFNKAAERLLGYSAEDVVGQYTPGQFHDPAEVIARAQTLSAELGRTIEPGFEVFVAKARHDIAEEREWSYIRKDGSRFPILLSVTAVRDRDGEPRGFLGIAVDITQRKALEAQAALAKASELSQRIVRAIGEGVIGVEDEAPHRIRFLNPAAEQLLNVRDADVIGQPLDDVVLVVADEVDAIDTEDAADTRAGETLFSRLADKPGIDVVIRSPGRDLPFPAAFSASRAMDNGGLDDRGLVVLTVQDVSRRWQSEEQLRLAEQVFEYSPEAILVTDGDGTILRVNPAFTLITGYRPEEALGRNPRILRSDRHDGEFYREMWRSLDENNHWHGEIWDKRKNGEIYPKWLCINTVRLPQGETRYVALFADISERKAHEDRVDYLARHDALTGLANRRQLDDRMTKVLASTRRGDLGVALMLIDLDRFKQVNDSLGHQVGDQLLVEMARRLNACVRDSDIVARIGGDEFVVVLSGVADHRDVVPVAEKIRSALDRQVDVGVHKLHTSPSIGISLFPHDGDNLDELLQAADIAMYQVKASGRNAWTFYEARMNEAVRSRHQLETEMREALERREFQLHYQPQYDVGGDRVVAWEALLRWPHLERGWVEPSEFIPVAEEMGLIQPLGEWVLATACKEAASWNGRRPDHERVAVNVSSRQFDQGNLVETVRRVLEETGLPPHKLELELTESALMGNTPSVQATLKGLKALGVHLTLDDFGTGYSSLGYLSAFSVDRLKIDRSFILGIEDQPNNAAIIHAVLALAKALGLDVVAEGVETDEQHDFLVESGCSKAQGFLYGRPMPPEAIAAFEIGAS